ATVWNFGTDAAIAQISDRIGFLVHGHGLEDAAADTNATWDVEQEKGIRTMRPDVEGYYAAEPGIRMNGAAMDWLWDQETDLSGGWKKAVPIGKGALRG